MIKITLFSFTFDKFSLIVGLVILFLRYFGGYKFLDYYFAALVGLLPYRILKESPGADSAIADIYLWQAFPVILFFFVIWLKYFVEGIRQIFLCCKCYMTLVKIFYMAYNI